MARRLTGSAWLPLVHVVLLGTVAICQDMPVNMRDVVIAREAWDCNRLRIALLLDRASSVCNDEYVEDTCPNWDEIINFASNFASTLFEINKDHKISVIVYGGTYPTLVGSEAHPWFTGADMDNLDAMLKRLQYSPWQYRRLDVGFQKTREWLYPDGSPKDVKVPDIVIPIIAGQIRSVTNAFLESYKLIDNLVHVIPLAIIDGSTPEYLLDGIPDEMASQPQIENVTFFKVSSFAELNEGPVMDNIKYSLCKLEFDDNIVTGCDGTPCKNNASCDGLDPVGYYCSCPDGFYGEICQYSMCSYPEQTVIVCENHGSAELNCPHNSVIEILDATYGRKIPYSYLCPADLPDREMNCSSNISMTVAKALCVGKQSCSVDASSCKFGDPCVGVGKYIQIKYKCVYPTCLIGQNCTSELMESLMCEIEGDCPCVLEGKELLTLTCPVNNSINVVSATFGRTKSHNDVCPPPAPQGKYEDRTDCKAPNSMQEVTSRCNGKNQCECPQSQVVFDEVCPDTYKYLHVEYECVRDSCMSASCKDDAREAIACEDTAPLNITCTGGHVIHVLSAIFGRLTPHENICTFEYYHLDVTNCVSENSMSVVTSLCQERVTCEIAPTTALFGEPCVGTHKYLQVRYYCLDPDCF